MDTDLETVKHSDAVRTLLHRVIVDLLERSRVHDASKLEEPERTTFAEMTPKLAQSVYGSEEYKGYLAEMRPALEHHYSHNRHHPEHFPAGIHGMNLLDLLEMLLDWKAASTRHATGDIRQSVELNQERFGYSDELKGLLLNTVDYLSL